MKGKEFIERLIVGSRILIVVVIIIALIKVFQTSIWIFFAFILTPIAIPIAYYFLRKR